MQTVWRWYLSLVLIGIAVLALILGVLQVTAQDFIFPDSTTYLEAAKNLYLRFEPHETRPILLAALNGIPLAFGLGDDAVFVWSYFLNAACWIGTSLLLFRMLRSWLTDKFAFLVSAVWLLTFGSATLVFHLLSESVYAFFLFLAVFLSMRYWQTGRFGWLSASLALMILLILIRPGAKVIAILAVAAFIPTLWKYRYRPAMLWIGLSVAAVFLQLAMMKKQFGSFTVSYIDSFTYYNYLGTRAQCLRDGETFKQCDNARFEYFVTLTRDRQKQVAFDDAVDQLQNNTGNFISAYFVNLLDNSIGGSTAIDLCDDKKGVPLFEPIKFALKATAKLQNIGFTIIGIVLSFWILLKMRREKILVASAVLILVSMALYGISSSQGDRFHLVLYPLILLIAGYWLSIKFPQCRR